MTANGPTRPRAATLRLEPQAPRPRSRGCARNIGIGCGLVVAFLVFAGLGAATCGKGNQTAGTAQQGTAGHVAPAPALAPDRRLVFTYYFYWYDALTGGHLSPPVMHNHFPSTPSPSWRSNDWQRKQLVDMTAAGIDVALPVFWGYDRPTDGWSTQGLPVLAEAWRQASAAGQRPPAIGMFFDTSIVNRRDLTTPTGEAWFYSNFKMFFSLVPRAEWALVDGRPVAFLFTSDFTDKVNQATFDFVYSSFQADFGIKPYIVREVSWDYPILRWEGNTRIRDQMHPIQTENSYQWAAALHGYINSGGVAEVGPGYDERGLPGRSGDYTDRAGGAFYAKNLKAAVASGKPLLAIETWNEMHEATDICESVEYGRGYLDITKSWTDQFHAKR